MFEFCFKLKKKCFWIIPLLFVWGGKQRHSDFLPITVEKKVRPRISNGVPCLMFKFCLTKKKKKIDHSIIVCMGVLAAQL